MQVILPIAEYLCRHFGECGGCQAQDVPYPQQLLVKEQLLRGLLAPFWAGAVEVTPSPQIWHYRNKVDPSFAPKRYDAAPPPGFVRETVLGFKRSGRWFWPMDIETCLIGPEGLDRLLTAVRAWHQRLGVRAYDTKSHEGFLRTLLVREGKRTGERMVVLITTRGALDTEAFAETAQGAFPAASLQRGIFEGRAEVTAADELEVIQGTSYIREQLHIPDAGATRILQFQISPFSFFQTNTLATELLYGHIRAWVKQVRPRALYDLYGGAGGIAFACSDLVERMWSVESVASATADGLVNARLNDIENVSFHTEKVESYLRECIEGNTWQPEAAVILDPSRAGLHPKALRRLIEVLPEYMLYVSCNPKILAQELSLLLDAYEITQAQGFDLFPHTRHVELVVGLRRR